MTRRLLTVAFHLVCVLVIVSSLTLLFRSRRTTDLLTRATPDGRYIELVTIPAQLRITIATGYVGQAPWTLQSFPDHRLPPSLNILGQRPLYKQWYLFGVGLKPFVQAVPATQFGPAVPYRMTLTFRILSIPLALPAFLAALPFAWRILRAGRRRRLRAHRLAHNLCIFCGYDLRSSVSRCPECGQPRPAA